MTVMYLPTKFCAYSSIQFAIIDISESEIQDGDHVVTESVGQENAGLENEGQKRTGG